MFSVVPNIVFAPNMTQNAECKHRTQDTNTAHFQSHNFLITFGSFYGCHSKIITKKNFCLILTIWMRLMDIFPRRNNIVLFSRNVSAKCAFSYFLTNLICSFALIAKIHSSLHFLDFHLCRFICLVMMRFFICLDTKYEKMTSAFQLHILIHWYRVNIAQKSFGKRSGGSTQTNFRQFSSFSCNFCRNVAILDRKRNKWMDSLWINFVFHDTHISQ